MSELVHANTRRWMTGRGFLTQNVASGCAFGAFGVTVIPLEEQFGISRGMATLGLARRPSPARRNWRCP